MPVTLVRQVARVQMLQARDLILEVQPRLLHAVQHRVIEMAGILHVLDLFVQPAVFRSEALDVILQAHSDLLV